jgi:hypothetical protein
MTTEYVVYINTKESNAPFAMRKRTWDLMVQTHKDQYGDAWEGYLKEYKVVAQGLSEEHAEGLVKLMKAGKEGLVKLMKAGKT